MPLEELINAVSVEDFKDIEDGEVVGTSQDAPVETINK